MGSNQVGFLMKGPRDLTPNRPKAIARAMQILKMVDEGIEAGEPSKELQEHLNWAGLDEIDELYDKFTDWKLVDVEKMVDRVMDLWEKRDVSDAYSRYDPDDNTQLLMWVGDSTWGDPPQGPGYTLINDAHDLDIVHALGIE